MPSVLKSTVLEEPSQFIEGCYCKYKKTIHQFLSFLATAGEQNKNIYVEGEKNSVVFQLTEGLHVSYSLPPYIFIVQLLSLKPQNTSGFPNNAVSCLFRLLPCYCCAPSPGNDGRLTAPDRPGTLANPQAQERMRKALLIKHKNGVWLKAQVSNLCPHKITQNT